MRTTRWDLKRKQRIRSRARDMQPIRGVSKASLTIRCKGVQAFAPSGSRKKIWDKKKSPLWVYVSPSISQQTINCGPLSRINWGIYLYKEVFRSFIEFRKTCLFEYITRAPSRIRWIVKICDVAGRFLRKPFWLFLSIFSILGSMLLRSRAL